MWSFRSSHVVFGEDALSYLSEIEGERAFIVTDAVLVRLGIVSRAETLLSRSGFSCQTFTEVEPDPSIHTVQRCAAAMAAFEPDWVVGLGGGSSLDAAKAAWLLYERPDVDLLSVNPMETYGLRARARFILIPTTAGSGAEITGGAVITDTDSLRKFEMGTYEVIPDFTIVDPSLSAQMPPQLTADTGIDTLTHAVEGYASTFANDFSDAACLHSARLVFSYLPRAVENGAADMEAREKMANAATLGGLGIGNSHIALAHALGHSAGALFGLPHGRITGLFLPYSIEYNAAGGVGRYLELAQVVGLAVETEDDAGPRLAEAIRDLLLRIGQPTSLEQAGVTHSEFETQIEALCDLAEMDPSLVTCLRFPYREDLRRLYEYAFRGQRVDF